MNRWITGCNLGVTGPALWTISAILKSLEFVLLQALRAAPEGAYKSCTPPETEARPGGNLTAGFTELASHPGMAPFWEAGTESTGVRHGSAG